MPSAVSPPPGDRPLPSIAKLSKLAPAPASADTPMGKMLFTTPDGDDQDKIFASVALHNMRTAPELFTGPQALDKSSVSVVTHRTSLSYDDFASEKLVREVYVPETVELVKHFLGAKEAEVHRLIFRKQPPILGKDAIQKQLDIAKHDSLKDGIRITGQNTPAFSYGPLRPVHTDMSIRGMHILARDAFEPFSPHRAAVVSAADAALATNEPYTGPRYAEFSIWRPLRTIVRDPLAISEWGTVAAEDWHIRSHMGPRSTTHEEMILRESYGIRATERLKDQRWWYVEGQTPDEVLFIKLCDSAAEKDPTIARGAAHASPEVDVGEEVPARESVEMRCTVFW